MDKVTERLIEIDDTVPELPVKDVVSPHRLSSQPERKLKWVDNTQIFRIYRDIRFSPDPTPYKVSRQRARDRGTCSSPPGHLQENWLMHGRKSHISARHG